MSFSDNNEITVGLTLAPL